MGKGPRDGKAKDEAGILPEERFVGDPEEARGEERRDAEDTDWASMVDRDPALFIKDPE